MSVAAALAALAATPVQAFSIDTGNPDVEVRWDNQIRYNAGWRMEKPNENFANIASYDESEGRFDRGDMVTNRLNLLSEMDIVYMGLYGFRVSGAAWYENAYSNTSKPNPAINYSPVPAPTSNYGPSGEFSPYAKRYTTGSSGEFIDAFVFGRFDLGSTTLNVKAGQHNIFWGESLYTIADGVSAGQGPIDTIKAATSTGAVEAKELFMPLTQISAQWSLSQEFSLMGQYMFDWKPFRIVPGGTYFASGGDGAGEPMCASATAGGGCIVSLDAVTPGRNGGDYGIALRWTPAWLDGTMGFYYRKYDEKLPWSVTQRAGANTPNALGVRLSYARDTELFGISLNKSIAGVSVGAELSRRHNTALNTVSGFFAGSADTSGVTQVAPGVFVPNYFLTAASNIPLNQTPGYDQVEGARGDTWHALVNGIWLLPRTAIWDSGVLQGELNYQRLDKVTKHANVFYSKDYACKDGFLPSGISGGSRGKDDGCSTKDSLAMTVGFTPEWQQVFPGVNMKMPTSFSYGLRGNSPTLGGSSQGAYKWSVGLTATYNVEHEFGLAYSDSHADYKTNAGGVTTTVGNADLNNRAWLSFYYKTSF
jgi:hypothetical protein